MLQKYQSGRIGFILQFILRHISARTESHITISLQTSELLKYILKDCWRAKRKFSGFATKMEEGSLLFQSNEMAQQGKYFRQESLSEETAPWLEQ